MDRWQQVTGSSSGSQQAQFEKGVGARWVEGLRFGVYRFVVQG